MKKRRGFSLVEALLSLALISLVLGLVAEGMNKLAKVIKASDSGSGKMELHSSLQRLCSELSSALTVSLSSPQALDISRVDPTLNRTYLESRGRLPWPWPVPPPATPTDPNQAPYLVTVSYRLVSSQLQAQTGSVVEVVAADLDNWKVTRGQVHLLTIEFTPKDSPRTISATAYLPMVKP